MGNKSQRLTKTQRKQITSARKQVRTITDDRQGELTKTLNSLQFETRHSGQQ